MFRFSNPPLKGRDATFQDFSWIQDLLKELLREIRKKWESKILANLTQNILKNNPHYSRWASEVLSKHKTPQAYWADSLQGIAHGPPAFGRMFNVLIILII